MHNSDSNGTDSASASNNDNSAPGTLQQSQTQQSIDEVNEVRNIRLPPFWKANPNLWFAQVDAQFATFRLRSDQLKYFHVISVLDIDTLQHVSDLIANPPENNKYESLKTTLIDRCSDSQERQIKKLLSEIELNDKKPSQLLREMRVLAKNFVSDTILQTLWLQRLPTNIQVVLSASAGLDLTKMSEIADKVIEVTSNSPAFIAEVSSKPKQNLCGCEGQISQLSQQVSEMSEKLDNLLRNRSRSRLRSSSRGTALTDNKEYCFYHNQFGNKAKKCNTPCSFNQPKN
ncbi:uncharacterized protein LOC115891719 [Sitophilus oryzae]|uniref:Uncharacterized protein LOC115891719 n=1 Tax=Sitophilus oryzae TaxID=7048 RepID=A0A6J2YVH4_SITOR|nr:uncharacterized protein LOC115891719 [Sitophilus oryzae]